VAAGGTALGDVGVGTAAEYEGLCGVEADGAYERCVDLSGGNGSLADCTDPPDSGILCESECSEAWFQCHEGVAFTQYVAAGTRCKGNEFVLEAECDDHVPAAKALEKLKAGNERFVTGDPAATCFDAAHREALALHGQNPFAAVIGCADSRCPLEILFDCKPGDLFVLRNAGNTCTHAEGSMVGSVEYSVSALGTNLILVLGHTKCGAIAGATKTMLSNKGKSNTVQGNALNILLNDLGPVAAKAESELKAGASVDEIAAHAVSDGMEMGIGRSNSKYNFEFGPGSVKYLCR